MHCACDFKMSNFIKFEKVGETIQSRSNVLKRKRLTTSYRISHDLKNFVSEDNLSKLFQVTAAVKENVKNEFLKTLAVTEDAGPDDRISATFTGIGIDGKLFMPYKRKSEITGNELLDLFEKWSQSNTEFLLEGEMTMNLMVLENPKSISGSRRNVTVNDNSAISRSVVVIKNNDSSCGYRAIALGCFYLDCEDHKNSKITDRIRKVDSEQLLKAKELCNKCQIDITQALSIDIIRNKIQQILSQEGKRIVVVDSSNHQNYLYKGPAANKSLYIEYINPSYDHPEGHYNFISNIKGYMKTRYFCENCDKAYNSVHAHSCNIVCSKCNSNTIHTGQPTQIICSKCQQCFKFQNCYNKHIKDKFCKEICKNCLRRKFKNSDHDCNIYFCKECKEPYHSKDQPHYCFIKPTNREKLTEDYSKPKIIIAYDIETKQVPHQIGKSSSNETIRLKHIPILLISQTICDFCWESEEQCYVCGQREKIFKGENCVKEFLNYIFYNLQEKCTNDHYKIYAFAHNARGFDAHFLLSEAVQTQFNNMNIVLQGRKILKMDINGIRFIDSLMFFQLPLSKLPKAFGLENTLQKGSFPYLFCPENYRSYDGALPDIKYFGIDYMKPNEASKLQTWYNKKKENNESFNFMKELVEYCSKDVEILLQSIMAFRKTLFKMTGIDPITRNITIPMVVLEIFRTNFLGNNLLAKTPIAGYTATYNQSISASCWLDWLEHSKNIKIKREYKIGKFYVDGFHQESNTVYEFLGCY